MSSKNFFWAKTSEALFLSLENIENIAKEAIKACVIDVKITWVSNYRCLITKSSNRAPVIGHLRDYVTNRRAENQSWARILL